MTDLDKLIEAVETGAFDGVPQKYNAFAHKWEAAFGAYSEPNFTGPFSAYTGSLDAAKALHDALLPDHPALIETVGIAQVSRIKSEWGEVSDAEIPGKPARALLLASLKAYRAQGKGGGE